MHVNQYCEKVSVEVNAQSYTMTNCETITARVFFYFPKCSSCLLPEHCDIFKCLHDKVTALSFSPNSHLFLFLFSSNHIAQMLFLTSLVEGNQFLTDGVVGQQQWLHLQKGSLPEDKPKAKKGDYNS